MRRHGCLAILLAMALLAYGSSDVQAQEATQDATYGPRAEASADSAVSETTSSPEPEHVELALGLAPSLGLGSLGGLGGLAGNLGLPLPVALNVAFPLGSRALVTVGASLSIASFESTNQADVSIPISAFVYLDRPRAGAFVSSFRVRARGTVFTWSNGASILSAGIALMGGLTYFFDEALAVRAEVGAGADAAAGPSNAVLLALGLESSVALVLRL